MSEGKIKINHVAPGTIVAAFEQLDACNDGVLDGYIAWSGYWVGKDTAFTLFASAAGGPFGMDTWDHTGWMFFGGGYDLFRELFAEIGYTNVVPFVVKGEFSEPCGWFPEPLEKYEDLAGYKMRVAGMAAEVFKEAGVSVMTVPGGEILPNLEKGVIDASEYSDPHSDLRLGIADVLKHYHAPGIHQPTGYVEFVINKARWEELPQDLKNLVEAVCDEMLLRSTLEEYVVGQPAFVELLTEYGVTWHETPDEILENLLKAWDKVSAAEAAKNPRFAKILESQRDWASKIVPYRGVFFKDYSFTADHYWK
jgi:TRAP-type mannitol/chloroaromatic compound transport system substrate-binding protein